MQHALLITAYKDFDDLKQLAKLFDSRFEIYIHIDKKSDIDEDLLDTLLNIPAVKHISRDYKVSWGGINHLMCYLSLAGEALKNSEISYLHLLTAQDYPLQSLSAISRLGMDSHHYDYLENFTMPAQCWTDGGMDRVNYYHLYDFVSPEKVKKLNQQFVGFQKRVKFKRRYSKGLPSLYGGSVFCSLTRETMQYVVDYTLTNRRLLKRFNFTFCSEEMYLQTVVMNSPRASNVVNDNLRYIDWNKPGRLLDEGDFERLQKSDKLFGRKFHPTSSASLKALLDNHICR